MAVTISLATATTVRLVLADDTESAAANPFSPANAAVTQAGLTLSTPGVSAPAGYAPSLNSQLDTVNGGYDPAALDTISTVPADVATPAGRGRRPGGRRSPPTSLDPTGSVAIRPALRSTPGRNRPPGETSP